MKKIIKIILYLFIPLSVSGQLTPVSDHYILNPLIINPAYAGNRGALNIAALYRRQWVGIAGAPETMTFAADAPFRDGSLGIGLIIVNDKIGVTKETTFNSNYSYKIRMGKGNLSFGLGVALITTNTVWSDLVVLDPGDEFYLTDSRIYTVPGFSFGMYYLSKNYFAGFSIPKLIGYKFDLNQNKYSLDANMEQYNYLFNTGFVIDISPKTKFIPSTLVTYSPGKKLLYDINANFSLFDRLMVGGSYRNNRSLLGFFQFQVNNQLRIAYTYSFDFGGLRTYSSGSHEIMLRYEFRYKVDAISPLVF